MKTAKTRDGAANCGSILLGPEVPFFARIRPSQERNRAQEATAQGRRLETVRVLQWYDGIVLALVHTSWREGIFLAALVSWSQRNHLRVLALLPVDRTTSEALGSAVTQESLLAFLKALGQDRSGKVSVVMLDETRNEIILETLIEEEGIRRSVIRDIELDLQADRDSAVH